MGPVIFPVFFFQKLLACACLENYEKNNMEKFFSKTYPLNNQVHLRKKLTILFYLFDYWVN